VDIGRYKWVATALELDLALRDAAADSFRRKDGVGGGVGGGAGGGARKEEVERGEDGQGHESEEESKEEGSSDSDHFERLLEEGRTLQGQTKLQTSVP
jgi:hypothetical protein